MFGNTHLYESTSFAMKQVKSKNRNRMAGKHWTIVYNLPPITLALIKERYSQRSLDHWRHTDRDL